MELHFVLYYRTNGDRLLSCSSAMVLRSWVFTAEPIRSPPSPQAITIIITLSSTAYNVLDQSWISENHQSEPILLIQRRMNVCLVMIISVRWRWGVRSAITLREKSQFVLGCSFFLLYISIVSLFVYKFILKFYRNFTDSKIPSWSG